MRSFHFLAHHRLVGAAVILASTLTAPQHLLAQTANTAMGDSALGSYTGTYNSAFGYYTLFNNSSGYSNTALGAQSMYYNTTGHDNTASGVNTLLRNTTGNNNTAMGSNALFNNTTGGNNTANGLNTLYTNTTGYNNIATGTHALYLNDTGSSNTAVGVEALIHNTAGNDNVAIGGSALRYNSTGDLNTAIGGAALHSNTTGRGNIAIGFDAGLKVTTGNYNIEIGTGTYGTSDDNGVIRIGNSGTQTQTFIAGIAGVRSTGGVQVYINSAGQLGTLTSSERFKKDIKSIDDVSDKLLQLRPVSFVYKEDEKKELQYGLIAEEVARVYPELVQYDAEGKPFTVYYHLLTPLLLSELQKEHALVLSQQATLTAQQEKLDSQQAELASVNRKLIAQHVDMLTMMQQQNQELAAMRQQLNELGNLSQAGGSQPRRSEKIALVAIKK